MFIILSAHLDGVFSPFRQFNTSKLAEFLSSLIITSMLHTLSIGKDAMAMPNKPKASDFASTVRHSAGALNRDPVSLLLISCC
jgi:hypothetical protein